MNEDFDFSRYLEQEEKDIYSEEESSFSLSDEGESEDESEGKAKAKDAEKKEELIGGVSLGRNKEYLDQRDKQLAVLQKELKEMGCTSNQNIKLSNEMINEITTKLYNNPEFLMLNPILLSIAICFDYKFGVIKGLNKTNVTSFLKSKSLSESNPLDIIRYLRIYKDILQSRS